MKLASTFARFAAACATISGSWQAFALALTLIAAWLLAGLWVGYTNELYQLVINTVTTIITFLMVFVLQNTQNRDTTAIHLKLDELIRATTNARDEMRAIETLAPDELQKLRNREP